MSLAEHIAATLSEVETSLETCGKVLGKMPKTEVVEALQVAVELNRRRVGESRYAALKAKELGATMKVIAAIELSDALMELIELQVPKVADGYPPKNTIPRSTPRFREALDAYRASK